MRPYTLTDFHAALDEFVEGTTSTPWKLLSQYLCGPGLRNLELKRDEAHIAERCWELLCHPHFASGILSFYNVGGWRDEDDELAARLARNAKGLFATALAAVTCRIPDGDFEDVFKWAARAVSALEQGATTHTVEPPPVDEQATPPQVLSAAFNALAAHSSAAATAHVWSLYWLNPLASSKLKRCRRTWIAWVSNGASGFGTVEVTEMGLSYPAIVEHPECALVPAEKDWIDAVARAWELAGCSNENHTISWCVRIPTPWMPLAHQSAGAAFYVAIACLRSGRPCDPTRAVLAALPGDNRTSLRTVGSIDQKITSLPKTVRAIAVAEGQPFSSAHDNVEINFCVSLERAMEFISDLATKMRSYLLSVTSAGPGSSHSPGIASGPYFEPILHAESLSGSEQPEGTPDTNGSVRQPDQGDVLPARTVINDLVRGASRCAVILAEGGYGKTWLARSAAKGIAENAIASLEQYESGLDPPCLTLPLEARDIASVISAAQIEYGGFSVMHAFDDPTARALLEQAARMRYEKHAEVLHYIVEGAANEGTDVRVLVIIDNLDGIAAGLRDRVFALLRRIAAWPCGLLLTSREYAFEPAAFPGAAIYRIRDLTPIRARRYTTAALADAPPRAAAVSKLLNSDQSVSLLARSPLLLAMICGAARGLDEFQLTRTSLYKNYLLEQLGRPRDPLGAQLRFVLLQGVGLEWFETVGPVGEISGEQLADWLGGGKVHAYPLTVPPEGAHEYSAAALTLMLLDNLVSLGIFSPTGSDRRSYRASHPSIIEYLAGARISTKITEGDSSLLHQLANDSLDPKWHDVVPFVAGSLKDPAPLLAELLRTADPFHMWLFTVANALAEVGLPNGLADDAKQVARRLVDLLRSPSHAERGRVLDTLGRMAVVWGAVISPLLSPLLDDSDLEVRASAIEAACAIATCEHTQLATRYVLEPGGRRRDDILRRLALVAPAESVDAAKNLLSDSDLDVRSAAAETLVSLDGDAYQAVVGLLKEGDGWSRRIACRSLALSESPEVIGEIKGLFGDGSGAVRAAAVQASIGLKARWEPNDWTSPAKDTSPEVRLVVTRAPSVGTEQLRHLLNDEDERVVLGAIEGLARSGTAKTSDFERLLEHRKASVRIKAAEVSHRFGVAGCIERLVRAVMEDEDAAFFSLAALASLRDPESVDGLLEILPVARPALQLKVVNTLGKIGDKRATAPLLKLLGSADPSFQATIALALGRIGDSTAYEPLSALIETDSARVRRAVVVAFGMLRDSRAVIHLLDCMKIPDGQLIFSASTAIKASVDFPGLLSALDARGGGCGFALSCPMPWVVYDLLYSYVARTSPVSWADHAADFTALTAAIHERPRPTAS